MNNDYLYRAKKQIQDPQILSIIAAKRAKLLAQGARPMIKTNDQEFLDIALLEIAEGLLSYEFATAEELAAEKARIAQEIAEIEAEERAKNPEAAAEDVVTGEENSDEVKSLDDLIDFEEIVDFENMDSFPEFAGFAETEEI